MSDDSLGSSDSPAMALRGPLVETRLVVWYFLAALTFLFISMLGGLLMALQLVSWNPLQGIELFSPGRWRMVHTNAIAYGFLANAFLGALALGGSAADAQAGARAGRLSYFIFVAWQVVVLVDRPVGHSGSGQRPGRRMGRDAGLDRPAGAGRAAAGGDQLHGADRAARKGPLYVTLWYFMAAFVWTFLTYAMGNFMPQYFVAGTSAGAVGGLFIHDLVGLFVTPLGWGLMYYFVPILLKKPIWSHGLSLVGFWGLAFFYPLNGIHHFLYTPIPMFLQYGAVISTIAVELVVTTVIINFFGTLWGIGPAAMYEPADPLVLHRHGVLLPHLPAVRLAGDAHVSGADSLHRLGRRACPPGDVRRVQLVAVGHHDLPVSAAAGTDRGTAASSASGTTGSRPSAWW